MSHRSPAKLIVVVDVGVVVLVVVVVADLVRDINLVRARACISVRPTQSSVFR